MDDVSQRYSPQMLARFRRINRTFTILTIVSEVLFASSIVLMWGPLGMPPGVIGVVAMLTFQFIVIGWGCRFIGAYFVRMEAKQDLGMALMMKNTEYMDQLHGDLAPAIRKLTEAIASIPREHVQRIVQFLDKVLAKLDGEFLNRLLIDLDQVIQRVKRSDVAGSGTVYPDKEQAIANQVQPELPFDPWPEDLSGGEGEANKGDL